MVFIEIDGQDIMFTSKRAIKRAYLLGEVGLPDAVPALVFGYELTVGKAYAYLGL